MINSLVASVLCFFICVSGFFLEDKSYQNEKKREQLISSYAVLIPKIENAKRILISVNKSNELRQMKLEELLSKPTLTKRESTFLDVVKKMKSKTEKEKDSLEKFIAKAEPLIKTAVTGGIITKTSYSAFVTVNTTDKSAIIQFLNSNGVNKSISSKISDKIYKTIKGEKLKKSLLATVVSSGTLTATLLIEDFYEERLGWTIKLLMSLAASLIVFFLTKIIF